MPHDVDSSRSVAVDREYYWRPIAQCPTGVKVQLINRAYGVAAYGHYNPKEKFWTHWAPLPVFRKESDGQEPDCGV
jgi:hypothetical protein